MILKFNEHSSDIHNKEITWSVFCSLLSTDFLKFTEKKFEEIKKLLIDKYKNSLYSANLEKYKDHDGNYIIIEYMNDRLLFITQLKDNWFIIRNTKNEKIYKCDDIIGLMEQIDLIVNDRKLNESNLGIIHNKLITHEEYTELLDHNKDRFTILQHYEIRKLIENKFQKDIREISGWSGGYTCNVMKVDLQKGYRTTHVSSIIISKIKDNWYLVELIGNRKFYKCDDIIGLMELLDRVIPRRDIPESIR